MSRALDALTCDVLRRLSLHRWDAMVSFAGPSVTVTVYELSTHLGYRESGADLARTTLRAMRRAGLDEGESAALYAELGAAIDRDGDATAPTIPAPADDARVVRTG